MHPFSNLYTFNSHINTEKLFYAKETEINNVGLDILCTDFSRFAIMAQIINVTGLNN